MRSCSAAGIPGPVSLTEKIIRPSTALALGGRRRAVFLQGYADVAAFPAKPFSPARPMIDISSEIAYY
jgi:hypothetical protein